MPTKEQAMKRRMDREIKKLEKRLKHHAANNASRSLSPDQRGIILIDGIRVHYRTEEQSQILVIVTGANLNGELVWLSDIHKEGIESDVFANEFLRDYNNTISKGGLEVIDDSGLGIDEILGPDIRVDDAQKTRLMNKGELNAARRSIMELRETCSNLYGRGPIDNIRMMMDRQSEKINLRLGYQPIMNRAGIVGDFLGKAMKIRENVP